jgi:hypothetical protein
MPYILCTRLARSFLVSVHFYNKILKVHYILSMHVSKMLLCRTAIFLWNSLLYKTSFFALLFTLFTTELPMLVNFVVEEVKIKCCVRGGWIIISLFFVHYRVYRIKSNQFLRDTSFLCSKQSNCRHAYAQRHTICGVWMTVLEFGHG